MNEVSKVGLMRCLDESRTFLFMSRSRFFVSNISGNQK